MSPLSMIRRATKRNQALSAAQMAHLRHTAYRGVDTSAHQAPTSKDTFHGSLVYRGVDYVK